MDLTRVTRKTRAVIAIDHVVTCCSIQTGIAGALIDIVLTVVAGESRGTVALIYTFLARVV